MDFINKLLLITVAVDCIFIFLILFKGREQKINRYFALVIATVTIWTAIAIFYRAAITAEASIFGARLLYAVAALIPLTFFFFAKLFLTEDAAPVSKSKILNFSFVFPVLSMLILSFSPIFITNVLITAGREKQIIFNDSFGLNLHLIYASYIFLYFFLGFLTLYRKYKHANEIQKTQLNFVFAGTLIATLGGSFFNLTLPLLNYYDLNWLGQIFAVTLIIFITYAIFKHHLMEVKVVGAEILTFLILFVLFAKILFSGNFQERLIDIAIFSVALIFSAFLIKSVLNEVKQKEQEKQINEHLTRINEELRELDSAKSEFISIAAHQLRTPLTVSKGYVSMILGGDYGKINEEEKAALSKVFLSNERLIRLVNDFLDVSKIETGKLQFDFKKTDVVNLISSVVEELASAAADSDLYLKFEKPEERIPEVVADELKIRQVVMNLIDNAVKYTQTGGITVSVELAGGAPRFVKIKIADTGVGLEKNEIERLFTKFTRTEAGKKAHAGGAGIGLYIAKLITEKHGGKIWAESEGKGKGSAFFVTLSVWPE